MASSFRFNELGRALERVGVVDVLLPFLLIFTIIFAVLEKSRILGEERRNMNTAIAVIFALIIVIPHITGNLPAGFDPVLIINAALPAVGLVVVGIISLMILIGVFAHDKVFIGMAMPGWIAFFSVVAIIIIFGSAAGIFATGFDDFLEKTFGSDALAIFIMLVVFGVIIAFVTGGDAEKDKLSSMKRIGFDFGKLFGK